MGKQVDWNASSRTISLSGTVTPSYETEFDHGHIWDHDALQVNIQPDISVVVDGKKQTLKAADGSTIYPLIYQDTSYLPLRAIGELMDKEVTWFRLKENHEEIYIRTPLTEAQKEEAQNYLNQASTLCKEIESKGKDFVGLDDAESVSAAQKKLDELIESIQQLKNLPTPSALVVQRSCEMLQEELENMLKVSKELDTVLEKSTTISAAMDFLFERDSADSIPKNNILQGYYLTGALVRMHQVLYQDGSAYEEPSAKSLLHEMQ